jgi:hypothetical protein
MIYKQITSKEAVNFLLPRHYSGRKPQITYAFGAYSDSELVAVCTFGKPASNSLCVGVCGDEFSTNVIELNRLCRNEGVVEYPLSHFVSWCLREIAKNDINHIVVSYSDTAMSHVGYIYQACNFLYTGLTKGRTDKYTEGNKHSRHYDKNAVEEYRKVRSPKHRYVYFCTRKKSLKKLWMKSLNYSAMPYPKGDTKHYELGTFLQPEIVRVNRL